jgi:hypothetical protein
MASIDSSQAAGITSTQLDSFDTADIAALAPAAVGGLTSTALASLDNTQLAALTSTQVAALTLAQVQALTAAQLNALNTAGLLDDITQPLSEAQITTAAPAGLGLAALNTTAARALFNSALQDASGTAALTLTDMASGAAAVVAAANGGTSLTEANLRALGLTDVRAINLPGIRNSIDATNNDGSGVDSMAKLRAIVTPITSDTTAPSATLTTGTTNTPGTANATVQSSEVGTAYLVKTGGTGSVIVSNLASITGADGAKWNSVAITAAATNTNLGLSGLEDGTYTLYTVDQAGNLSGASSTSYVVDTTAPTFSSLTTATFVEKRTAAAYDAQTTEGDTGMVYTLSGGVDANLFNINATTGAVTFKNAPNVDSPQDNGSNNVYDFTVRATDLAGNATDRAVALTVILPPVLDALGNSGAASYSLRLLDFDYADKATKAITVRRSITPSGQTATERDIGFTASGELDTAALLDFAGTGDVFVKTWYDQSGNGRHATQATANLQPQIVSNGALLTQNGRATVAQSLITQSLPISAPFTGLTSATGATGVFVFRQLTGNDGAHDFRFQASGINNHAPWRDGTAYDSFFSAARMGFNNYGPASPASTNTLTTHTVRQTGIALQLFKNGTQIDGDKTVSFQLPDGPSLLNVKETYLQTS